MQDVFHVELPDLGELAAVEVGHDNSGAAPGAWQAQQHPALPCLCPIAFILVVRVQAASHAKHTND